MRIYIQNPGKISFGDRKKKSKHETVNFSLTDSVCLNSQRVTMEQRWSDLCTHDRC
jgi:hypothetical protein